MKAALIDTSVIVALLDKSESSHELCKEIIQTLDSPLVTCEAVIAETCYLLRNCSGASAAVLKNVEQGIFHLGFDLSQSAKRIRELMKKYQSVPMDFADACLVCLAEELETDTILTLDQDFQIYRWSRNRRFVNLLDS